MDRGTSPSSMRARQAAICAEPLLGGFGYGNAPTPCSALSTLAKPEVCASPAIMTTETEHKGCVLRSMQELEGFAIHATDGAIGHVSDFYFDDHTWVVRYLVVQTGSWLLSRKVLISPVAL